MGSHRAAGRIARCLLLAAAMVLGGTPSGAQPALAGSCVQIVSAVFDAPGDDRVMPGLNGEYVVLRNRCSRAVGLGGYRVQDRGAAHVYRFPARFRLQPAASVRLHSGTGSDGSAHLYWGRRTGQVWNNAPPEWAYLVDASGATVSRWSWPLARVASHGSRASRTLALTIDDGSNPSICREVLAILVRERVPATWLPTAEAVELDPGLWRDVAALGFPIANHTTTHPWLDRLGIRAQFDEISGARSRVERILGERMLRAVRPPYGAYDERTRRAATAAGFPVVVTWEATFADTAPRASLAHQVSLATDVENGSIVLMHCNPRTPTILEAVLPVYRARGFTFVTLGRLLGLGGPSPTFPDVESGGPGEAGRPDPSASPPQPAAGAGALPFGQ